MCSGPFTYTKCTCWMIRWPGNLTDDYEGQLGFDILMRFWGPPSSDNIKDVLADREVVLLSSKILDMLWPVWGRVGRRFGCGRVRHCRPGRPVIADLIGCSHPLSATTTTGVANSSVMGRTPTKSVARVYADVNAKLGPSWHEYGLWRFSLST